MADELDTLSDKAGDKTLVERLIAHAPMLNDQPGIKKRVLFLMHDFHDSFFQRETDRIWPILEESANRARAGVESGLVPMRQIIENLTNGLTLAENVHYKRVVLAPSFFGAPFVGSFDLPNDGILILYPARPEGMRVDGERVDNERLLRRLKALADKTRLEILQLLAQKPHYTQELADALNLKQPTNLASYERPSGLPVLFVSKKPTTPKFTVCVPNSLKPSRTISTISWTSNRATSTSTRSG